MCGAVAVAVRDSIRGDRLSRGRRVASCLDYIWRDIDIKYIYRVMDLFGTSTSEERTTSSHLAPRASTPADPRSISPVPTCHSSALPTTPSLHSMFNIQYLYCRIVSSFRYARTPYFSFRRFLFDRVRRCDGSVYARFTNLHNPFGVGTRTLHARSALVGRFSDVDASGDFSSGNLPLRRPKLIYIHGNVSFEWS